MSSAASELDVRLIERFKAGEQTAFDALVARHRRPIHTLVCHMLGDKEAAEDVTLEVFFQAYLSLPNFERRAKFSTWLHRIAVNVCLQYLRQPSLRRTAAELPLPEHESFALEDTAQLVIGKETAACIREAMQGLPETQRAAVIFYYLQERSFAEIGEILRIPANTAKTRIFHGTKLLRNKLRELGILPACQSEKTR